MRPNPPRMVTVVLAVGLLALGLVLLYAPDFDAASLVRELPLSRDLEATIIELLGQQMFAYLCLAAAPVLLIVGSLLPGI